MFKVFLRSFSSNTAPALINRNQKFVKLTVHDHNHNGLIYQKGFKFDFRKWRTEMPCSPGGIYIIPEDEVKNYTNYDPDKPIAHVWNARVPKEARIHEEYGKKFKVDSVILSHCRPLKQFAAKAWNTEDKQLDAVKANWFNIKFIKNPSKVVQLQAVQLSGEAIQFIPNPTKQIQFEAIKRNAGAIRFVNNPSTELQLLAVNTDPVSIRYLLNSSDEIKMAAVKEEPMVIKFLQYDSLSLQIEAVRKNPQAIGNIEDPVEMVQMIAVINNPKVIDSIKNPTPLVKTFAKQKAAALGKKPKVDTLSLLIVIASFIIIGCLYGFAIFLWARIILEIVVSLY